MACEHCGAKPAMGTLYMCGSGHNTDGPFRGEICRELVALRAIVGPLEELRAEPMSSVLILCDAKVEPHPGSQVVVKAKWTGHVERVFTAQILAEALDAANTARKASES